MTEAQVVEGPACVVVPVEYAPPRWSQRVSQKDLPFARPQIPSERIARCGSIETDADEKYDPIVRTGDLWIKSNGRIPGVRVVEAPLEASLGARQPNGRQFGNVHVVVDIRHRLV